MIRLTCTQCKSLLEMDEAFAGGVCRCQYCGTIQTVPAHLKGSAAAGTPAGAAAGSKRLYQGGNGSAGAAKGGGNGTGLDELADVVASSGLSRSGLRQGAGGRSAGAGAPASGSSRVPLMAAAGAVILILVGVIVWLATRTGSPAPDAGTNSPGTSSATNNPDSGSQANPSGGTGGTGRGPVVGTPNTPAGPHYLSLPIQEPSVVYVVDRSGSVREFFDALKASVFASLDSLGADRQFGVVFADSSSKPDWKALSFPNNGLTTATTEHIQACKDHFEDVGVTGTTDLASALKRAAGMKPDAIFLMTAKGLNLDPKDLGSVQKALNGSHAKVYTIDLTTGGDGKPFLEPLAKKSGGTYTKVAPAELR